MLPKFNILFNNTTDTMLIKSKKIMKAMKVACLCKIRKMMIAMRVKTNLINRRTAWLNQMWVVIKLPVGNIFHFD